MNEPKKKVLSKNAIANVAQTVITSCILLLLYRYINQTLGLEKLGIWSVVLATIAASRLADLGITAGASRVIAQAIAKGDFSRCREIVDTATILIGTILLCLLPFLYIASKYILSTVFTGLQLEQAIGLLPFALASLWLSVLANVAMGTLEGAQRMDLRAYAQIASQLINLLLSIAFTPKFALIGLAIGQFGQSTSLLLISRLQTTRAIPMLGLLPKKWNIKILLEMRGYIAQVQASAILTVCFDPLTKALIAKYCGAELAGTFEICNQIILRGRSLIISATQALVPHIAGQTNLTNKQLSEQHHNSTMLTVYFMLTISIVTVVASPTICELLLHRKDEGFIFMMILLSIAWTINTFVAPIYFINLGLGNAGRNTLCHAIQTIFVLLAATAPIRAMTTNSIVFGYAVGLVIAAIYLAVSFGHWNRQRSDSILGHGNTPLLFLYILTIIGTIFNFNIINSNENPLAEAAIQIGILAALCLIISKSAIFAQLRGRFKSSINSK